MMCSKGGCTNAAVYLPTITLYPVDGAPLLVILDTPVCSKCKEHFVETVLEKMVAKTTQDAKDHGLKLIEDNTSWEMVTVGGSGDIKEQAVKIGSNLARSFAN